MAPPPRRHPRDLIEHIAATIRRVDGNHTTGAAALAEAIVANLPTDATLTALHAEFAEAHACSAALTMTMSRAVSGADNSNAASRRPRVDLGRHRADGSVAHLMASDRSEPERYR